MRQITSDVYGILSFEDNQVYSFDTGILGIPDVREYVLFPMENTPFFILHALEEKISFILLPAYQAIEGYSFQISEETIEFLEIQSPEELGVMLVVNIQDGKLFVNLMAPILISPDSRKGCQYIIRDQELSIRYPLQPKGDI